MFSPLMYQLYLNSVQVSQLSNNELLERIKFNRDMLHNIYNINYKHHFPKFKKLKRLMVTEKFWLKHYIIFRGLNKRVE